jgi:hypothetical protein
MGFSVRSAAERRQLSGRPPISLMPVEYLTPSAERRSVEVQAELVEQGKHRARPSPICFWRRLPKKRGSPCCMSAGISRSTLT